MNTPAHVVLNLLALERGRAAQAGPWIAIGAALPDLPNAVMFAIYRGALGMSAEQIYAQVYPSFGWQLVLGPSHSIVVIGLGLALALWRRHVGAIALLLSAALHVGLDLLTHVDDAHPHLWPLSDARWSSPLSYWDRSHHAAVFVPVELALVGISAVVLWRRGARWRRVLGPLAFVWLAVAYATGWAFWGT